MATDPRGNPEVTVQALMRLGAENAALREKLEAAQRLVSESEAQRYRVCDEMRVKLEAAEAKIAEYQKEAERQGEMRVLDQTDLVEARAAQAAAWEAAQAAAQRRASACWLSGYIEGRTGKTCTPPADLAAALQRVRDGSWNEAIRAAAEQVPPGDLRNQIRALRRAPTEGEG